LGADLKRTMYSRSKRVKIQELDCRTWPGFTLLEALQSKNRKGDLSGNHGKTSSDHEREPVLPQMLVLRVL
jgi:hypothetical protein